MVPPYFYLDDEKKLHEKEVEFLCDNKNAHLFLPNEEEDLSRPKKRKLTVSSPEYLTFRISHNFQGTRRFSVLICVTVLGKRGNSISEPLKMVWWVILKKMQATLYTPASKTTS